ncbi:MAG: S41 family peptidase [Gemmatimonadales bacterium]|jgi:C-terminal processing protease CtpA/Prc
MHASLARIARPLLSLILWQAADGIAQIGPPPDMHCDAGRRAEIIDSVSAALNQVYVFPEVAAEMERRMRSRLRDGAYDEFDTIREFTSVLTRDLQGVSRDRHLRVGYVSLEQMTELTAERDEDEARRLQLEALARSNFNFRRIEILSGNVGYLRFDSFVPAEYSGATAIATMNFLAHCDALIIDLRNNGGGSPSLIQLITSYFFNEPVHLNSFYVRETDSWQQFWTQSHVEGPRMADTDLYVLTSEFTFSGAEEFTYNLKNLERATIVGDTTGGGAHPVSQRLFTNLNVAMALPFGRAVNPLTETNWEGVGVIPDIAVDQGVALETAHLMALRKIRECETDDGRLFTLDWHIQGLEAQLSPVTIDPAVLESYAGSYGPRTLTFEDGELWYHRAGRPLRRAIPMTERLFRFDDIDTFRLEVVLDESGRPVKLIGHYDNGTQDESARTAG